MRSAFRAAQLLTWLLQLGLSAAVPMVGFVLLAVWLKNRFALGGWVILVGVLLGLMGMAGGLYNSFKTLHRLARQEDPPPRGYNHHD